MEIHLFMTMVRMAQEWSMRYRLVDGQGNGSVDGDSPAQCVIQRLECVRFQNTGRYRNC
jgi:hypothetical protein